MSAGRETTGQTPVGVLFGREMQLQSELKFDNKPGEEQSARNGYVEDLRRKMHEINKGVCKDIEIDSDRTKQRYDTQTQECRF